MGLSVWQIAIIAVVVLVLFGRGRISEMMGDFGKGISSFKKGMNEEADRPAEKPAGQIGAPSANGTGEPVDSAKATDKSAS
ncbi:twin-arginine translocase TatA/TatE family subunit [Aurantiacibacter xanthus]|uniref:Sec-independent protein translocase protein TatA n=1 Tax=Aurantiacibacter xanthus TaxID=1784712 RepID=A0A3A1P634_9SPHN|nr:twin-arginine translocase TatA/TatE family subunit [Aurantiacibacter xanthus]RIV83205.1 twin-arginine translocase TatA/TatE family subunit [Aurantiacibacter xanthus]